MRSRWMRTVGMACAAWGSAAVLAADTGKPAETAVAERGPFEVVLELKGTLEPVEAVVVGERPESYVQPLEIMKVVPHGTRVAEGDLILELDVDPIERAIADLEVDAAAGEKSLELARRELAAAEATTPLELAAAERQDRVAKEDLARFTAVGREVAEEGARFAVKAAEQRLRSAQEELAQLERMYRDKDLTEETEEMILQRTRFDVEAAQQALRQIRITSENTLTVDLPRRGVDLEHDVRSAALALAKARATLPVQLEQRRCGVVKQEHEVKQSRRKLAQLEHDRGLAVVKVPRSGIVHYGRLHNGSWSTDAVAGKAIVGQAVPLGELVFTVVGAGPLRFRAKVDEKDLHLVQAGLTGRMTPTGFPDVDVPVAIEPGFVPVPKDGGYTVVFSVAPSAAGPTMLAGMSGAARFVVRSRADAVTVPEGAVFRDGDGARVVYVERPGAAVEKRVVKPGLTSAGRTEILEGLAADDRVRTAKP